MNNPTYQQRCLNTKHQPEHHPKNSLPRVQVGFPSYALPLEICVQRPITPPPRPAVHQVGSVTTSDSTQTTDTDK